MDKLKDKTCEEFESELWLLIDESIDDNALNKWDNHLSECDRCRDTLDEARSIVKTYKEIPLDDISDQKFNAGIYFAIQNGKETKTSTLDSQQRNRSLSEIFGFYKLAFGGSLLAVALIFIFITFFRDPKIPDIKNTISNEMLGWNTPELNQRMDYVETQILSLQTNDWDIYIVRKNKKEEWNSALRAIQDQIRKMKKEVVSASM